MIPKEFIKAERLESNSNNGHIMLMPRIVRAKTRKYAKGVGI
jgi:hypothetical protein